MCLRCVSCVLGFVALFFTSCESERHFYELNGDEVEQRKPGESMSLEDRFTGTFDVKKGVDGVTEAKSNKVSSFQGKLDSARKGESPFASKGFDTGALNDLRSKSFEGGSMAFAGARELDDRSRSAFTPDNVPDFMKPGKGVTRKDFAGSSSKSSVAGKVYQAGGDDFVTKMSPTTRLQESGYFESKRDAAPEPSIMSKDEYTKLTMDESRNILGRNRGKAKDNSSENEKELPSNPIPGEDEPPPDLQAVE